MRRRVTGLTTPIDMAFTKDGTMYVLQYAAKFDSKHLRYVANTGSLVRIGKDGSKQTIVTDLMFPTALTVGPDDALYVSDFGNESNFGEGTILRVVPGDTSVVGPPEPEPKVHGTYDIPKSNETLGPGANVAGAVKVDIVEPKAVLKWGYAPKLIEAKAGQKILFTNTGQIAHTATSTTGKFDTGLITQPLGRRPERGGHLQAHLHAASVDEGDDRRQRHDGRRLEEAAAGIAKGKSPSLDPLAAVVVVGGVIGGMFALAWFARRRNAESA